MIKIRQLTYFLLIFGVALLAYPQFFSAKFYHQQGHVEIADLRIGKGASVLDGAIATVNYVTRVQNGPVVSASNEGQPFTFVVGAHQVLPGWEDGLIGLRVGGRRKILIPPKYAYGERGSGQAVPPKATLEVELELLSLTIPVKK